MTALAAIAMAGAQAPPPPAPLPPPAAAPEPPELSNLRQNYFNKALLAGHTLTEQFQTALNSLERELGAAGDYEQALVVQKRRLDLAETYKATGTDASISNSIVLKPSDAHIVGSVSSERTGVLSGWKTAGSTATWDILRLTPGAYDVAITYAAESSTGVVVGSDYDFFEDSNLSGAAANARSFQLPTTTSISTFATVTLPAVTLQRTSARFTLRATRVKGIGNLMSLKEIRLTPAKTAAPAGATPTASFASVHEAYVNRITSTAKPLVDGYLAALKSLEADLTAKQDTDAVAAVQTETARVTAWLANPVPLVSANKPAPPASFPGNFQQLDDARFVPRPTNTGDRFPVIQDGKEILIHLLWVSCPPTVPDDKPQLKYHADYFGITEKDALDVGKEAADFTTAFLTDRPLKILTKGNKDKDGALLAVVVAANIGDLASVLVDNGLAAVLKPASRPGADPKRREEQNIQALKEREAAAIRRPIPAGAWALAPEGPKS